MKVCPACRTTFDDSQNFCLSDGTPLVAAETEPETVVTPPESNVEHRNYRASSPSVSALPPPVRKKSNTGSIVAVTALATVLLIGLGAGAWWALSRDNSNQQVARTNSNANSVSSSNSSVTPRISPSASNVNANSEANSAVVLPTNANVAESSPTPPAHQLPERDAATVRKEVSGVLDSWAKAIESGDFNGHLSYYADTLDYYYRSRGLSKNQVRADKQRAFASFDEIKFNISNVRVTPEGGDRASVVYDKEWVFENAERTTEGKVQSQLALQKIGGRWLIVGERDLKVYYQDSQ